MDLVEIFSEGATEEPPPDWTGAQHQTLRGCPTEEGSKKASRKPILFNNMGYGCLVTTTNKTHVGNYNRLLKIKTTKAQNLHLSINTIILKNPDYIYLELWHMRFVFYRNYSQVLPR